MSEPKWVCGVTTVPDRRAGLLPITLDSVAAAGFPKPRLFVDGADPDDAGWYARRYGLDVTARGPGRILTFGNWALGLAELYVREPRADWYAMFQDDVLMCRGVREYLDRGPTPGGGIYLNLYTNVQNNALVPAAGGWFPSNQLGKGALALVFPAAAVVPLVTSLGFANKPRAATHRAYKSVDGAVSEAMRRAGHTEYCHAPSLVQHLGTESSMGNRRFPPSPCFAGEGFDAAALVPGVRV